MAENATRTTGRAGAGHRDGRAPSGQRAPDPTRPTDAPDARGAADQAGEADDAASTDEAVSDRDGANPPPATPAEVDGGATAPSPASPPAPPASAAPVGTQPSRWPSSWRPYVMTRAGELEGLLDAYDAERSPDDRSGAARSDAARRHLHAAQTAAGRGRWWPSLRPNAIGRAIGNLDAGEAFVVELAPDEDVPAWLTDVRSAVRRFLSPDDPRRAALDELAAHGRDGTSGSGTDPRKLMAHALRGATSASRREHARVRSFRNAIGAAAVVLLLTAVVFGLIGWLSPGTIPLCFESQSDRGSVLSCPTASRQIDSDRSAVDGQAAEAGSPATTTTESPVTTTPPGSAAAGGVPDAPTSSGDVALVLVLGMAGGALAAAVSMREISGTYTPFSVPIALALLKLPTGAVTALAGLVFIRGGFVPGLSALDSPGQIVAWAILLGMSQQFLTRVVDRQGQVVLDRVGVPERSDERTSAGVVGRPAG